RDRPGRPIDGPENPFKGTGRRQLGRIKMKSGLVRRLFLGAALALPMLGIGAAAQADGERFVFISHAPDSDSWWNVIKNALKDAEKDFGVTVEYRNPPNGDLADMARIIEQATA